MPTIAQGVTQPITVPSGVTVTLVSLPNAEGVITVTPSAPTQWVQDKQITPYGPPPTNKTFGPYLGPVVLTVQSVRGSIDYTLGNVASSYDPTNVAITGGTIRGLQKLRRAVRAAQFGANEIDNSVAATLPTVTTAFDAALSTFFAVTPANNGVYFNAYGGTLVANSLGYTVRPNAIDSGQFGTTTIEFVSDAPKLQFRAAQGTMWVTVNGHTLSTSGTATAASGGEQQIVLDWSSVRTPRVYRFSFSGGGWVVRVGMDALSRMWAPSSDDVVRVFLEGDSYVAGTGGTQFFNGLGWIIPNLFGFADAWNGAVGGTGWLNAGSATTFRGRIANVIAAAPDLLILPGGTNDSTSSAAIQAEVQTYLTQLRAALPNTPAILLGPWPKATGPSAGLLTVEAGIKAAVLAQADPLVAFVPVSNDPAGSWIFGTGFNGSGSGNAALWIGPDGAHPTDAGHNYHARYATPKIANALKSMTSVAI